MAGARHRRLAHGGTDVRRTTDMLLQADASVVDVAAHLLLDPMPPNGAQL